jgi:hypothetical protein
MLNHLVIVNKTVVRFWLNFIPYIKMHVENGKLHVYGWMMFENRVLRKIFGCSWEEVTVD